MEECPICLEVLWCPYVTLDCKHSICLECYNELNAYGHTLCPLCRKDNPLSGYRSMICLIVSNYDSIEAEESFYSIAEYLATENTRFTVEDTSYICGSLRKSGVLESIIVLLKRNTLNAALYNTLFVILGNMCTIDVDINYKKSIDRLLKLGIIDVIKHNLISKDEQTLKYSLACLQNITSYAISNSFIDPYYIMGLVKPICYSKNTSCQKYATGIVHNLLVYYDMPNNLPEDLKDLLKNRINEFNQFKIT